MFFLGSYQPGYLNTWIIDHQTVKTTPLSHPTLSPFFFFYFNHQNRTEQNRIELTPFECASARITRRDSNHRRGHGQLKKTARVAGGYIFSHYTFLLTIKYGQFF